MTMINCFWKHDNLDTLYGVTPQPIDRLPQVCVCGAEVTYADKVAFLPAVWPSGAGQEEVGTIEVVGIIESGDNG